MPIYYLCFFIAIIHLIATLSYGVRIAGARTGKVAFCLSLFNILVLVSRTSNTLLTPALSKRVESSLATAAESLKHEFHLLIFSASAATLVGGVLPANRWTAGIDTLSDSGLKGDLATSDTTPSQWRNS